MYDWDTNSYYSLESIVLTLAFMALLRIKNPEQLKQCKPGEIGRIIGLDRIPEVKCLREKLDLITRQQKATHLNNILVDHWYGGESSRDADFLYIDGHVRVYYGAEANLPTKYVSRQKLCLSATTEYWVNDARGMPVLMVMGELTDKLQDAIEHQIIPQLQEAGLLPKPSPNDTTPINDTTPLLTLIFDREVYSPKFFRRLWEMYRIAIITYRKYVKDKWPVEGFQSTNVHVLDQQVIMQLCEQETVLDGSRFREIRRLSEDGHQTPIVSTHPTLETASIAGRMFGRWSQENFFRYLIADYDFDKMVSYGIEAVDPEKEIVNPEYRKVNYQLKKLREKIRRLEAGFFPLLQLTMDQPIDELPSITKKQIENREKIDMLRKQEEELKRQRSQIPPRLKISQMPEQKRYNKLKTESKIFMNVIKMICYRAESAVAQLIEPSLAKSENEKRMVVKQIIRSSADLTPDYENNTLTVTLHCLSANRFNMAALKLAQDLNETETIFPGTDLKMIFKISAISNC